MFRDGLKILIDESSSLQVVGEAKNGIELLKEMERTPCDILLLDLSMPGMHGIQVLKEIRKIHSKIKILILTMHKEREYFQQALAIGINGYILKEEASNKLITAINEIIDGKNCYSAEMVNFFIDYLGIDQKSSLALELLTKRECEIVQLIADGLTSKEISEKLRISRRTVETHRYRIMEKLQIKNLAELVKFAMHHGLVA